MILRGNMAYSLTENIAPCASPRSVSDSASGVRVRARRQDGGHFGPIACLYSHAKK